MGLAHKERMKQYGHPKENFALIGKLWGAYLGIDISADDVASLMVLFKTARLKKGYKADTVKDIIGYAECIEMIQ